MLDSSERLPPHQRDALRIAFGLTGGPPPDRFLSLLTQLARLHRQGVLTDDEFANKKAQLPGS